jgi:hypothetical protein
VTSADARLVQHIQQATLGATRMLCTLARKGKTIEHDQPDRAESLLTAVRYHPLYKGGRLAFDMLEIEDLMLEDASVASIGELDLIQLLGAGLTNLLDVLGRLGSEARNGGLVLATITKTPELFAGPNASKTPMPELPRVSFGSGLGGANGQRSHPESARREPDLNSSDYLYDYVVIGILDILSVRLH